MSGYDSAKQIANELKMQTADKLKVEEAQKQAALNSLAVIRENAELANLYNMYAQVGAKNLGGEVPILKVHATGRSTNELADGSEPKDGAFFYKPTAEQYDTITCHVLTISKGFTAPGMADKKTGKVEEKFNQLLGGLIIDNGEYKPFIMYFTGSKLSKLWDFGKRVGKYTRAKPVSIPMFALTIKLTTEKVKNDYGSSWIINFDIVESEDGSPVLVLDPGEFQFLKDSVSEIEDTITSIIDARHTKEVDTDAEVIDSTVTEEEVVNPEDVPF